MSTKYRNFLSLFFATFTSVITLPSVAGRVVKNSPIRAFSRYDEERYVKLTFDFDFVNISDLNQTVKIHIEPESVFDCSIDFVPGEKWSPSSRITISKTIAPKSVANYSLTAGCIRTTSGLKLIVFDSTSTYSNSGTWTSAFNSRVPTSQKDKVWNTSILVFSTEVLEDKGAINGTLKWSIYSDFDSSQPRGSAGAGFVNLNGGRPF